MSDADRSPSTSYRYELAPEEAPSHGVWSVVAVLEDSPPPELPSLGETIDPDALDAAFTGGAATEHLSFEYAGYAVTMTSDAVRVRALEGDADGDADDECDAG
ncbi:HalOD1 output domain-containing protein [Natronococcus sp.]|uniref:HalOD1 output domain-containing protein n=1 Tax=Natronococcus sp. TaxID=35747 RepID=UPI003A4D4324